jgi:phenylpropionate dioxygenase-like ring-hydroxylating dioxygenase large terminal subunit
MVGRAFGNQDPSLRHCFHPVCRTSEVGETALTAVRLLGEDWALARIRGELVAFENRCPHRGAPLAAGTIVDDSVQCRYHGYRFGSDGRCTMIPALGPDTPTPSKASVRTAHAVEERYGLVWLAPGAPVVPIIDVPEWNDPAFVVCPIPDQVWRAGAAQMVDNFLDLAHFPFTHLGTFGDPDDQLVARYSVERDGLGFTCDYRHSTKVLADSMGADAFAVAERRSTWSYVAPFAIRLRIHYIADDVVLTILFFHQPIDADHTRLYCFDLRDDIADGRTTVQDAVDFQMAVAEEDRALLETLVSKDVPLDLGAEVHTRADRITVEMRRVLQDLVTLTEAARS